MKKLYLTLSVVGFVALTPMVASAIVEGGFDGLIQNILAILDLIVILIIALALVFFLWGVAKFILNAGDPEEQNKGKSIMFWGIIALFVMVAVWGLVNFLEDALVGPGTVTPPETPGK